MFHHVTILYGGLVFVWAYNVSLWRHKSTIKKNCDVMEHFRFQIRFLRAKTLQKNYISIQGSVIFQYSGIICVYGIKYSVYTRYMLAHKHKYLQNIEKLQTPGS